MRWSGSSYIDGGLQGQSLPFVRAGALALVALSLGGCAQLGLPFVEADARQAADRTLTGATRVRATIGDGVDPSDWEAVRRAVATAPDGNAADIAWSNPDTGSEGTILAAAAAAGKSGTTCRTLEATINDNRGARRYRGEACQRTNGRWQITRMAADDAKLS